MGIGTFRGLHLFQRFFTGYDQVMSMKVLVIMGSPRKGNTYRAAERIREIIQEKVPVEWEYVMLKEAHLEDCRGCYQCFERGEEYCTLKDEASLIEQKMKEADGVIFATPVYGFQVSYLMKLFIDRHGYIFHRPRFFRQKALLLTSAGAVGSKDVLKYLTLVASIWGFDVAAKVGIRSHATFGPPPPLFSGRTRRNYRGRLMPSLPLSSGEPVPGRTCSIYSHFISGEPLQMSWANGLLPITSTGLTRDGSRRGGAIMSMSRSIPCTMPWECLQSGSCVVRFAGISRR